MRTVYTRDVRTRQRALRARAHELQVYRGLSERKTEASHHRLRCHPLHGRAARSLNRRWLQQRGGGFRAAARRPAPPARSAALRTALTGISHARAARQAQDHARAAGS